MIHDFAKSPRINALAEQASPQRPPRARRLPKGRWILALAVILSLVYWRSHASTEEPVTDFEPGASESREYQQALEEQRLEQELVRQREAEAAAVRLKEQQREQQLAAELKAKVQQQVSEPEFGFYESLPESAWQVPVQRGVYVTEEDRKRANQRYMLQAASVREFAQAQQLVQRLRQLGLQASYTHDSAGGWYRVNVGPFDNVSRMNKAEDILVAQRMMPLKRRL